MEVIKPGRTKTGWKHRYTCSRCRAELLVENTDCKLVPDQRDGDYYAAKCPECGYGIAIAASVVHRS